MRVKTHLLPWGDTLYYVGPDLDKGALPAFIYFSLAGDESLALDPFNQPVIPLLDKQVRTFSLTLPGHGKGFDKHKAIAYWAEEMGKGHLLIEAFIEKASKIVDYLLEEKVATKVATGGLSRGAFIATHLTAANPKVGATCGFAPLTDLSFAKDFVAVKDLPAVQNLSLIHLIPKLTDRPCRFYIGNRDLLVGTEKASQFIIQLADAMYERRNHALPAELIITPSIGAKGHGTKQATFEEGSRWIWENLSSS